MMVMLFVGVSAGLCAKIAGVSWKSTLDVAIFVAASVGVIGFTWLLLH